MPGSESPTGTAPIYPVAPHDPTAAALAPPPPPASAPPAAPPAQGPEAVAAAEQRAARVAELRQRRSRVSLTLPVALGASGVALLAVAASSGIQALVHSDAGNCDQYENSASCFDRGFVWGFAGASIGTGVLGAALIGVAIPKLRRAMGERRALRDEMRSVSASTPSLALNLGKNSAGFVLRASY